MGNMQPPGGTPHPDMAEGAIPTAIEGWQVQRYEHIHRYDDDDESLIIKSPGENLFFRAPAIAHLLAIVYD